MRAIYSFSIRVYSLILSIASLFHPKAKKLVEGRRQCFDTLSKDLSPNNENIWFHAASLGEFEQGRPLIERIKKEYPNHRIIISFYSPSGYEVRKDYSLADSVVYLPLDTKRNARRFLDLVSPKMIFFIKYEFWFNFIDEIHSRGIELYQVSLILRPNQYFFSWYGKWFAKHLSYFNHHFVQNQETLNLLSSIGIGSASITGDTRFDRVIEIADNAKSFPVIQDFAKDNRLMVCGSTWKEDEDIIALATQNLDIKLIIAPHEIDKSRIDHIKNLFPSSILYTELDNYSPEDIARSRCLIINTIGMLSSLYQYSYISYIGGGFGAGIHNLLEATAHGSPVCFGPNYHRFQEAKDLIDNGGGYSINNANELEEKLDALLDNEEDYKSANDSALGYTRNNSGGTSKIISMLKNSFIIIAIMLGIASCSPYKHISKDGYLLNKNQVNLDNNSLKKDNFQNLIKQDPNTRFLFVRWGMYFYSLSPRGDDSTMGFFNKHVFRSLGEKPVEYDINQKLSSVQEMRKYLLVKGCFDGRVEDSMIYAKRWYNKRDRVKQVYNINLGERYRVDSLSYRSVDKGLSSDIEEVLSASLINKGDYYDEVVLGEERNRIERRLKERGYFDFSKEYILFRIDTNQTEKKVDIEIYFGGRQDGEDNIKFHKYKMRRIYIKPFQRQEISLEEEESIDTTLIYHRQKQGYGLNQYYYISPNPREINPKPLLRSIMFQYDTLFSPIHAERTFSALSGLRNFRFIDISYSKIIDSVRNSDTVQLDAFISLSLSKPILFSTSLEANFSAATNAITDNNPSNFGLQYGLGFQNKNLLKNAEIFSSNLKFAIELRSDIFDKSDSINTWNFVNAFESGIDFALEIPRFLIPFGTKLYSMQFLPSTTIRSGYNFQKRPYFERSIFNLNYGYSWNNKNRYYSVMPIEINLVKMNITNQDYADLIQTFDKRIQYQTTDHLVMDMRFSYMYNGQDIQKRNDFQFLRLNAEIAGNLLYLASSALDMKKNENQEYTVFNIPYAQYIRTDFDYKNYRYLSENTSLVFRAYGGIAIPYANANALPYEKSFFGGGSNNLRAWQLRELGPGSSKRDETQLRFDRSGDMSLGGNIEYRFPLFGVVEGATFLDIGNVWTISKQKGLEGGEFRFDRFYKEFAAGAGLGIRLNIEFLIIRVDMALKLWDPSKDLSDRFVLPNTKLRDLNLNLGIGYPF